jgi:hypothetical protein
MFKIITTLAILLSLMLGCSSNEKVTHDNRREITRATKWNPEFIFNDTCSGIKLEFIPTSSKQVEVPEGEGLVGKTYLISIAPSGKHKVEDVSIKCWAYPIDTVVQIQTHEDYRFSLPSYDIVDLTEINYEIKNTPITQSLKVDSGKALYFNIPSGTYLMVCKPGIDYVGRWIKDVIIIPNCWSVVKLDTVPIPFLLY